MGILRAALVAVGVLLTLTVARVAAADTIYLPQAELDIEADPGWKVEVSNDTLDGVFLGDAWRAGVAVHHDQACHATPDVPPICPGGYVCAYFPDQPDMVGVCENVEGDSVVLTLKVAQLQDPGGFAATMALMSRVRDAVRVKLVGDRPRTPIGPRAFSMPWWGFGRAFAEAYAFHDEGEDRLGGGGRMGWEVFVDPRPNRYGALLVGGGANVGWDNAARFLIDGRVGAGLAVKLGAMTLGAIGTAGVDRRGGSGFNGYVGVEGIARLPLGRRTWFDASYTRTSHEHRAWVRFSGRREPLGFGLSYVHYGETLGVGDDLFGVFAGFGPP